MMSKKVYIIQSSVTKERVSRSHSDIRWLQEALKEEYSGLLLPEIPERTKEAVNIYFSGLLELEQLRTSFILHFFVSCVSENLFKDFKEKKEVRKNSLTKGLTKEPNLIFNRPSLSKKDLDEIMVSADKLKDMTIAENADFNQFASKVNDVAGYTLIIFNDLKKAVEELNKQITAISKTFNHIADLFSNLSLQTRKLNSAKEQFPDPKLKELDLEQVYAKYKLLFYNTGSLIRTYI